MRFCKGATIWTSCCSKSSKKCKRRYNSHSRGNTNSSFQFHRKEMSLNYPSHAQFPRLNQISTIRICTVKQIQPPFLYYPLHNHDLKSNGCSYISLAIKANYFQIKQDIENVFLRRARLHCCAPWSIFYKFWLMFSLK